MAGNVTNTLTANITSTNDTDGTVPINRGTGNPAFDSAFADFTTYQTLSAGAHSIALPQAIVYQVYIKNIDPTTPIVVNWTPQGNASGLVCNLYPGEQLILWANPNASHPNAGITALQLTVSANTLVEYFLGG